MTRPSGTRVRMKPDTRREQLLELGGRLLATRSLDELSIELLAEEAGISRGLLYHYFGNKEDFHVAVVRRVVDDLYAATAPQQLDDPLAALAASVGAYVDFVVDNHAGYVSLVRAAGGNERLRSVYLEARRALTGRIFDVAGSADLAAMGLADTPATRLLVDGWAAFVEDVVLGWIDDPHGLTREQLLDRIAHALPAMLAPS